MIQFGDAIKSDIVTEFGDLNEQAANAFGLLEAAQQVEVELVRHPIVDQLAVQITPDKDQREGLGIIFVDDVSHIIRANSSTRHYPQYMREAHVFTLPVEALANRTVLGAVALHEAVHALDLSVNALEVQADADRLLAAYPDAVDRRNKLSEIRAFEIEGLFLECVLGERGAEFFGKEVPPAVEQLKNASNNQGGVTEVGVDREDVLALLKGKQSFTSDQAEQFGLEVIGTALLTYVGFKAIDELVARQTFDVSDEEIASLKVAMLPHSYHV
jgi:hypothetical protein